MRTDSEEATQRAAELFPIEQRRLSVRGAAASPEAPRPAARHVPSSRPLSRLPSKFAPGSRNTGKPYPIIFNLFLIFHRDVK